MLPKMLIGVGRTHRPVYVQGKGRRERRGGSQSNGNIKIHRILEKNKFYMLLSHAQTFAKGGAACSNGSALSAPAGMNSPATYKLHTQR